MRFLIAFISLFAAIDIIAVLPVYTSLTAGLDRLARDRVVRQSCLTAFFVATGFALAGRLVLRLLGIEVFDFKMAGGLLLVVFSIQDLTSGGKARREPSDTVGVVPLGMPLIVGPAVLTTIVILLDTSGHVATLAALLVNLIIVWVALRMAPALVGILGVAGTSALGKVASLLLAALGVMMMRRGLFEMLAAAANRPGPALPGL